MSLVPEESSNTSAAARLPSGERTIWRVGDLDAIADHVIDRKRAANDSIGERLAVDVLHDQEVDLRLAADVVERANVRMVERGDRFRFALETEAELRIRCMGCRQNLHRDGAIETRARKTSPIPPAPMRATISYGPSREPLCSVMMPC